MNKFFWPVVLVTVFTIVACVLVINEYEKKDTHKGQAAPVTGMVSEAKEDVPESETEPDISKDTQSFTGIVTGYDPEEGLIVFKDTDSDKTAAFHYDGTTAFYDRFGQSLTAQELKPGDVTDVSYNLADGMLAKVSMSNDCFTMTDVVKFSVDEKKRIFSIAGEPYKFTEDIFIYSDDEKSEWMDITNLDTLTVRGKEKNIYSVVVTKGHGYLRLKNDSYFIGGWIEVGNEIIKPVSEDMLIPCPEGDFHVRLTNKGYQGEVDITVKRNKETVMDLSKIHIEEVAIGHVEFKLSPEYAQLYIDGELTEYEDRVPVEFGVHSIKVEAAGYESVSTNIKVSSEYVNIEIALDPDPNATSTPTPTANPSGAGSGSTVASVSSDSPTAPPVVDLGGTYGFPTAPPANTGTSSTGSTSSSGSTSTSSTDTSGSTSASSTDTSSSSTDSSSDSSSTETVITATKKLYVEQPAGAEVYLDGVYIGIAPTSTPKVTGSHVVTLSRSGFVTKSYTVNIDDDGNDITLSFGSLSPEEDE